MLAHNPHFSRLAGTFSLEDVIGHIHRTFVVRLHDDEFTISTSKQLFPFPLPVLEKWFMRFTLQEAYLAESYSTGRRTRILPIEEPPLPEPSLVGRTPRILVIEEPPEEFQQIKHAKWTSNMYNFVVGSTEAQELVGHFNIWINSLTPNISYVKGDIIYMSGNGIWKYHPQEQKYRPISKPQPDDECKPLGDLSCFPEFFREVMKYFNLPQLARLRGISRSFVVLPLLIRLAAEARIALDMLKFDKGILMCVKNRILANVITTCYYGRRLDDFTNLIFSSFAHETLVHSDIRKIIRADFTLNQARLFINIWSRLETRVRMINYILSGWSGKKGARRLYDLTGANYSADLDNASYEYQKVVSLLTEELDKYHDNYEYVYWLSLMYAEFVREENIYADILSTIMYNKLGDRAKWSLARGMFLYMPWRRIYDAPDATIITDYIYRNEPYDIRLHLVMWLMTLTRKPATIEDLRKLFINIEKGKISKDIVWWSTVDSRILSSRVVLPGNYKMDARRPDIWAKFCHPDVWANAIEYTRNL